MWLSKKLLLFKEKYKVGCSGVGPTILGIAMISNYFDKYEKLLNYLTTLSKNSLFN